MSSLVIHNVELIAIIKIATTRYHKPVECHSMDSNRDLQLFDKQ